jgi:hypothetical protein
MDLPARPFPSEWSVTVNCIPIIFSRIGLKRAVFLLMRSSLSFLSRKNIMVKKEITAKIMTRYMEAKNLNKKRISWIPLCSEALFASA